MGGHLSKAGDGRYQVIVEGSFLSHLCGLSILWRSWRDLSVASVRLSIPSNVLSLCTCEVVYRTCVIPTDFGLVYRLCDQVSHIYFDTSYDLLWLISLCAWLA